MIRRKPSAAAIQARLGRQAGFTLLELAIVIVCLGIMAVMIYLVR